jgi:hypothetical protein
VLFEFYSYEINNKKKTIGAVSTCCSTGSMMKDVNVSTDKVLSTYVPNLGELW